MAPIIPAWAAKAGSIDVLVNSDSLPAMERAEAVAHLAEARRLGIGYLLSINPETRLPDQTPVAELARLAGGYRLTARHRHWLRSGHVEELYRSQQTAFEAGPNKIVDV